MSKKNEKRWRPGDLAFAPGDPPWPVTVVDTIPGWVIVRYEQGDELKWKPEFLKRRRTREE